MVTNKERKSCVKCKKAVTSTEKVLMCGLWCRNVFHNDCVGLSNSETRIVTCSKQRIKFHCETCDYRLGIERSGEKETHEPNKLENCVNSSLLELVQKILKVTSELSNDNTVLNAKLDTVLSSNARLEEYIFQSPKCSEKGSEEIRPTDNSIECVENFAAEEIIEISEENKETISDNPTVNSRHMGCAQKPKHTDNNSSLLPIASNFPKQLSDSQQPNVAEECDSNECSPQQDFLVHRECSIEKTEYEEGEEMAATETVKEECSPSEDILVHLVCSIEKTEYEEGEETADSETGNEEYSSSEDFLGFSTFSIEKPEDDEDGEDVGEYGMEECNHEIESTSRGNEPERLAAVHFLWYGTCNTATLCWLHSPVALMYTFDPHYGTMVDGWSTVVVGRKDIRNKVDISSLNTDLSQNTGKCHRILCTTNSSGNKSGSKCVVHECDICKESFINLHQLKEHIRMSRCRLRHSCLMCHKRFSCKSSLEKHFRIHTREKQIICDICNMIFTHKSILKQHLKLHSSENPFICSGSNKAFKRNSTLRQHFSLHSDERTFTCSVCNKAFRWKGTLVRHLRLHSGERPFSCSVCNKAFNRKCALREHCKLHSGERPFSCSVCNKRFRQKSSLARHLRLHSGERPYGCNGCNKTFTHISTLQTHMRIHSGERPFSCSVCSKTFARKNTLKKHLSLHSA